MFLSELNENERKDFLDLAIIAMSIAGKTSRELEIFKSYSYECKMPDYVSSQRAFDDILDSLSLSTPQVKKAVLIEILGIFAADNKWSEEEVKMMYNIGKKMGIPESMVGRLKRWAKDMREIIAEGYELILR